MLEAHGAAAMTETNVGRQLTYSAPTATRRRSDRGACPVVCSRVDVANRLVSTADSIPDFVLLPRHLIIDDRELTPTLKVRRAVVEARCANLIDGIYGRP